MSDTSGFDRFGPMLRVAVADGVSAMATVLADGMKEVQGKGARFSGSAPGTPPNVQRGRLRNSFTSTRANPQTLTARAGTNVRYGLIQERGATINAKPGKALPVPISEKAKRTLEKMGPGMSLRTVWPSLVLINMKGRKGKDALLIEDSKGAAVTVHFVLKKSVRLPPRPWARPSVKHSAARMVSTFQRVANAKFRQLAGVNN